MAVDIEQLSRKYFFKDKPVDYLLKCGITINMYPILVKDWDIFEESFDVLTYPKNETPSAEIIKMSYLEFIAKVLFREKSYRQKFDNLLRYCLKEYNNYEFYREKNKIVLIIFDENDIVLNKITSKEFDDIKKIILYQNVDGYDDTVISKDIRKLMNDYYRTVNGDIEPLSLEDKMAFLGNNSSFTKEQMLNMTYREFSKRYNWAIEQMDYQINKTAEMSGNVKFEKKIEHLIYRHKKNKFEQFFSDREAFKNKINGA